MKKFFSLQFAVDVEESLLLLEQPIYALFLLPLTTISEFRSLRA